MTIHSRHSRNLALIVACAAAMTACGGGQEASATAGAQPAAAPSPTVTHLAASTNAAVGTAASASAAAAPQASPGGPVITAAMVRKVGAPPRPDNGVVVVHPGIRNREHATADRGNSAGARSARTPNIGD